MGLGPAPGADGGYDWDVDETYRAQAIFEMRQKATEASNSRGTSETRVVLPDPVDPMIAVVRPGSAVKVTSCSTGESAPG